MSGRTSTRPVTVTAMRRDDVPQVVAIHAATSRRPWPARSFSTELERDDRRYVVARTPICDGDTEVVGFAGVAFLGEDAHVMTIAVETDHQAQGVGRRLVAALLDEVARAGLTATTLEVRTSNVAARRLYRRCGFDEAGVRPGYYPDGEDAAIMWHRRVGEVS